MQKGMAHLDRLNHKDRIKTPMLKVDGVWKEISFDKAIEIMAEKLTYYKEKYTSKSVMHYDQYGSGSVLKYIGDIFLIFMEVLADIRVVPVGVQGCMLKNMILE